MHEDRIHGPTINPAQPPPRACGPGPGEVISAGGDVDCDRQLPPKDGKGHLPPHLPWAERPGGAGGGCPCLPSRLVAGAACFPFLEKAVYIPAWKIHRDCRPYWDFRPRKKRKILPINNWRTRLPLLGAMALVALPAIALLLVPHVRDVHRQQAPKYYKDLQASLKLYRAT